MDGSLGEEANQRMKVMRVRVALYFLEIAGDHRSDGCRSFSWTTDKECKPDGCIEQAYRGQAGATFGHLAGNSIHEDNAFVNRCKFWPLESAQSWWEGGSRSYYRTAAQLYLSLALVRDT